MVGTRRIKLVKLFARCKIYLVEGLDVSYQGVSLGLLGHSDLNAFTQMMYSSSVQYQSDEHNLSGLFKWETDAVDSFFNDCRSILVGAAGGGREIIALSNRGIRTDGFEYNQDLLNECKHLVKINDIESKLILSAPNMVQNDFGVYDGIICGWGAYIFIPSRLDRVNFLKNFRKHVKPNGPILLSFFRR